MRNIFSICRREILSFFVSPVAYFVLSGFVLLAGYFFFNLLGIFNIMVARYQAMMQFRQGGQSPNLNQWVVEPYFHTLLIILVFLIPVLTMRTIAEEKRRGTFELLMTSPLSVSQIVIGKFLGVAFVLFLMALAAFSFPLLLVFFGNPGPEFAPVLSGLLAVFLCSLGFAAVAMGVSAFTENQIVAAISGMVALLLLYVIHSPSEAVGGVAANVLKFLSPVMQSQDMIRGVITTTSTFYYVSLVLFGLFLSHRALEAQRWR